MNLDEPNRSNACDPLGTAARRELSGRGLGRAKLQLKAERFERPADFDLHACKPQNDRSVTVRVLFDHAVSESVIETRYFYLHHCEMTEAGMLAELRVREPEEVLSWLLGWGAGMHVFAAGEFPPMRIKVPESPDYTPANPTDLESVREQFLQLIKTMREVEPSLSQIPADVKIEHPRLGFLNAKEWFQLVCMHFPHHLRQKERLDHMIRSGK
ncbi:WYL domain-containing protein [Brevibacillus sp. B_LB10_24]|uniref:WYL domain-containing protein n=1 Tax=Brevibacillus sp. B_LB10_24 TaxID=3380645 RepID=UPI0038BDEF85